MFVIVSLPTHSDLITYHLHSCSLLCAQNNGESLVPPPAPPLKAQISPLANMFNPEPRSPLTSSSDHNSGTDSYGKYEAGLSAVGLASSKHISTFIWALEEFVLITDITRSVMFWFFCGSSLSSDQGSLGEGNLSRSTSQSSGLNVGKKPRVRTIFPHTAGNNPTLLSFEDGDIITLLIQEEKDGWLYGELEKNQQWVLKHFHKSWWRDTPAQSA